jgi:hypothetical protein
MLARRAGPFAHVEVVMMVEVPISGARRGQGCDDGLRPVDYPAMIVYHVTGPDAAAAIDREGFADNTGHFMLDAEFTGVWVSDVPLEDAWPDDDRVVFEIDVPTETLSEWECVSDRPNYYREWLIPAAVLNCTPRVRR